MTAVIRGLVLHCFDVKNDVCHWCQDNPTYNHAIKTMCNQSLHKGMDISIQEIKTAGESTAKVGHTAS